MIKPRTERDVEEIFAVKHKFCRKMAGADVAETG